MIKVLINLIALFIPSKKLRHKFRNYCSNSLFHLYSLYVQKIKYPKILKKIRGKNKLKVVFLVVFDSIFSLRKVFELMQKDENFDPYICVIPDISRGKENMFFQLQKTYNYLSKLYKNVINAYDYDKSKFKDLLKDFDLAVFDNPYDSMTHKFYRITTSVKKNILSCYTEYGYKISNITLSLYNGPAFNLLWKVFTLNNFEYKQLQKNYIGGINGLCLGYSKMDRLNDINIKNRERKRIIISPHHTVGYMDGLCLSNFLRYSDFFLELPQKYPQIDFVFRPHPLLWISLLNHNIWSKTKIDTYIHNIKSFPNVEYQDGGDYFETFVNSDGLIHDCGSFSMEYLFTGKPCCYMLKNDKITNQNSNDIHRKSIDVHYKSYDEDGIVDFIENVILKGNDYLKIKRENFYKDELKYNYPNTSLSILQILKKELKK